MEPITAVIVGAGHRAMTYASYAKEHPEALKIVGVADPNPIRRQMVAEKYNLPPENCFSSAEELALRGKIADAVINGTMDKQHVPTSLPLLEAGYHMLLEKPFSTNEEEMWELVRAAKKYNRHVAICHVLRYAPFYAAIRKLVLDGEIGEIVNIQTTEHVSYHHLAVSFVRGKWNNKQACASSMLMAKCCHDLDLIMWMKSGIAPSKVASFGSLSQFKPEKAPQGAGKRCLVDCKVEQECLYSARKHYLDEPDRWGMYVWELLEDIENPTLEDKERSLKTDNPHGRCVYRCDNDVVDRQSVIIEFEDGCTITHNMIGGTARPSRSIHLIGTLGEIQGTLEDSKFVVRKIDPRPGCEYSEKVHDLNVTGDMHGAFGGHGGGDLRLIADFCQFLQGGTPSISSTTINDSIYGHLVGFRAEEARLEGKVLSIPKLESMLGEK